uniref:GRF-type domain-containing protein n=1 Tax=Brassica oleracea var. oleracea TaxID=109376 RepID=A0A0D3DKS2_BRAOL
MDTFLTRVFILVLTLNQQRSLLSPANPEDTPVDKKERRKWTKSDDEVVISGWLNTSKDSIVGNDQRSLIFWQRVGHYYITSHHAIEGGDKRGHLHVKQRWHKINDLTNKFCGAFAAAERQISSGQNENDVLKLAHDILYADHKTKFILEHAWCVLRFEQKWINLNTPKATGSSKRKTGETCSQASSTNVGEQEIRPEGVKAAKAKRNNGKGKSLDEYTTIWEMKKEDLAMKEKLSKLAILDTLLAKKVPLSDAEEVVKNKPLADYTQPSESEENGGNTFDSGYSKTKALIRQDQAEVSYNNRVPVQYPPQPEVEFRFPQTCYCGAQPLIATSNTKNDPGRRYYTCANVDDGECHVWKWWDDAVMEEMRARDTHILQLAEKVDYLTLFSDNDTDLNQLKHLYNDTE